jgi:hypothetical protein
LLLIGEDDAQDFFSEFNEFAGRLDLAGLGTVQESP